MANMLAATRPLGATGLQVAPVGLGTGRLGDPALSERHVEALLWGALDRGVSLIDTAPSYGLAEERVGRHLSGRRRSFVLSTKLGYGVSGVADWTPACISAGIDRALRVLRTDVIDLAFLHSCPRPVLERGGVIEPLLRAVRDGKVRAAGYSGEGDALAWAVRSGAFSVVQASVNLCDASAAFGVLREARARGVGVLAKRPLAGAPWRPGPTDEAGLAYRLRWQSLGLRVEGDPLAVALPFCLRHADAALIGTTRLEALDDACKAALVSLDDGLVGLIEASLLARGRGWPGLI